MTNKDMEVWIRLSKEDVCVLEQKHILPRETIRKLKQRRVIIERESDFFDNLNPTLGISKHERAKYSRKILGQAKLIIKGRFYNGDDLTFYIEREPGDVFDHLLNQDGPERLTNSLDCSIDIQESRKKASGRALVCSCFRGKWWSITFRKRGENEVGSRKLQKRLADEEGYRAGEDRKNKDGERLNSIRELCDKLYGQILSRREVKAQGLIIVTGRTASAKSQIVRGLVQLYLKKNYTNLTRNGRRPHLVTYEDPIEKYFFKKDENKPLETQRRGLDYTARQKGVDVANLKSAVKDALRQTPAVMFVGEIRNASDWQVLIEFAGTGHLVFTTTHAGSLTEAMGNIFKATKAETPAARSVVADRILALIHLRHDDVSEHSVLIPALWRQTPSGAKALMAEGRAALLPHNPEGDDPSKSSLGRRWFARKLLEGRTGKRDDKLHEAVMNRAIEWDMEGI